VLLAALRYGPFLIGRGGRALSDLPVRGGPIARSCAKLLVAGEDQALYQPFVVETVLCDLAGVERPWVAELSDPPQGRPGESEALALACDYSIRRSSRLPSHILSDKSLERAEPHPAVARPDIVAKLQRSGSRPSVSLLNSLVSAALDWPEYDGYCNLCSGKTLGVMAPDGRERQSMDRAWQEPQPAQLLRTTARLWHDTDCGRQLTVSPAARMRQPASGRYGRGSTVNTVSYPERRRQPGGWLPR